MVSRFRLDEDFEVRILQEAKNLLTVGCLFRLSDQILTITTSRL